MFGGEAVSWLWLVGDDWIDVPVLLWLVGLSGDIESALDVQFAIDVGVEAVFWLEVVGDDWKGVQVSKGAQMVMLTWMIVVVVMNEMGRIG